MPRPKFPSSGGWQAQPDGVALLTYIHRGYQPQMVHAFYGVRTSFIRRGGVSFFTWLGQLVLDDWGAECRLYSIFRVFSWPCFFATKGTKFHKNSEANTSNPAIQQVIVRNRVDQVSGSSAFCLTVSGYRGGECPAQNSPPPEGWQAQPDGVVLLTYIHRGYQPHNG